MEIGKKFRVNRGDTVYTVYQTNISRWYVVDVFEDCIVREKAYVYLNMPNVPRCAEIIEMPTEELFTSLDDAIEKARAYFDTQIGKIIRSEEKNEHGR